MAEQRIGETLGGCRLEAVVGRGAMGVVYQGAQVSLDRAVAVKVMSCAQAHGRQVDRFFREAKAAARLVHRNVVQVYDCGQERGVPYIVMELVRGASLKAHLVARGGRLPVPLALRSMLDAARGLAVAHSHGLIHRDVKPDNILIAEEDGVSKVADFGLVKGTDGQGLTMEGVILGTPDYISPEQCQGGQLDGRADLYSLGACFYHVLAGTPPFTGPLSALLFKHVYSAPRPLRELEPQVPEALSDVVMRLLAKSPDERFAHATEVACALESAGRVTGIDPEAEVWGPAPGHAEFRASSTCDAPVSDRPTLAREASARGAGATWRGLEHAFQDRRARVVLRDRRGWPYGFVWLDRKGIYVGGGDPSLVDILCPDPRVSDRHFVLSWRGNDLYARDVGSTHGTYLNALDHRLNDEERVRPGDELLMGDLRLRIEEIAPVAHNHCG